jgi:O-antigen/teichoic acid export membrane protein
MSLKKELINGAIGSILVRIIGTGIAFILSVFLARTLGSEGFGLYSFVLSFLIFLSIPVQGGFPNLIVRETAKAYLTNDWPSIKGLFLWALKLIVIYITGLGALISLLYVFDVNFLSKERLDVFIVGFILTLFIPVLLIQNSSIRGLGRVVLGVIPDAIIRPGLTLLITGFLFFVLKEKLTPYTVILIYIISTFVALSVSSIAIWMLIPKESRKLSYAIETGKWRKAIYPLTVVGGLQLMYSYIDIIILGFFYSDEDVGVYRAAVQLAMLVVFGLSVINQMLHPYYAKLYAQNKMDKLQKLVTYSSFIIFGIAAIPSLIFIIAGEFVLSNIFGEEYILGAFPLAILTIGQLANSIFGPVGALLNMTGHEEDSKKGMFYSLSINLLLSFILIPLYGAIGAAVSTAVSVILWNVILRYYVKIRLNIESIGFIQILKNRGA